MKLCPRWTHGERTPLDIYLIKIYNKCMKPISIHVAEEEYEELKLLAATRREPVAQLIRKAMRAFLESERASESMRGLRAHDSGNLLRKWSRDEIYDEMLDR